VVGLATLAEEARALAGVVAHLDLDRPKEDPLRASGRRDEPADPIFNLRELLGRVHAPQGLNPATELDDVAQRSNKADRVGTTPSSSGDALQVKADQVVDEEQPDISRAIATGLR
jgi:hypothetical protein